MFRQKTMFPRNDLRIDLESGALAITSPYSPTFVTALKATVPNSDRKWDGSSKRWLVSVDYGSRVQQLIERHYGCVVDLPEATGGAQASEMRLLNVRYIGAAKSREDGSETAYGWSDGGWTVIFPKPALMEWFGQTQRPDESQTLYGVLGVSQGVDAADLKTAWRRMARTWHPDVSREPGSAEQFRAIQEAYEILSDEIKRARYDAGLALEASAKAHTPRGDTWLQQSDRQDWRPPLRCGLILVEGQARLSRFVVSKVLQWGDIVNSRGEVLVTSWAAGDDHFTEAWVSQ